MNPNEFKFFNGLHVFVEMFYYLLSYWNMRIILGSASEGRKKIFSKYFPSFEVIKPNLNEDKIINRLGFYSTNPTFVAMYLSYEKSEKIVNLLASESDNFLLFTFDTIVVHQGDIKFKPSSKEEARNWLFSYRNDFQEIITGYTIFSSERNVFITGHDRCIVYFKDIEDRVINEYIDNNPVETWSGGIAIEIAKSFFNIIEGNIESIIGVPVSKITKCIDKIGIAIDTKLT